MHNVHWACMSLVNTAWVRMCEHTLHRCQFSPCKEKEGYSAKRTWNIDL